MTGDTRCWTIRDFPLLAVAMYAVVRFRLLLTVVSLRRLREGISRIPLQASPPTIDPIRIGRAVTSCAHRIPKANCLPRALATQWMLRRRGIDAQFCIGAGRDEAGEFAAHAWVTCNGTIVVGGLADGSNYSLMQPR